MDISNLSGQITKYITSATGADAQKSQIEGVSKDKSTDEEMLHACKQFEEYLVEMVMDEVAKGVNILGMGDASSAAISTSQDFLKDSLVQQMATQITETGDLGIAQRLYESMKRNHDIPAVELQNESKN